MNKILSFESPLEYLLRYTVLVGMALAAIGFAILLMSKSIAKTIKKTDKIEKGDKIYGLFQLIGVCLIVLGIIFMALDIKAGFYVAK